MKVLLDENLPHKLRDHLAQHDTATVAYLGWGGLANGELLKTAEQAGFEIFVTGDRALEYQQSMTGRRLAVISLSANNWPIIKNHIPAIVAAVKSASSGSFTKVDCGSFARSQKRHG